jgi:putative ABC transport system permease protein
MKDSEIGPPSLAARILRSLLPDHIGPDGLAEHEDLFRLRAASRGRRRAILWYWSQVAVAFAAALREGFVGSRDGLVSHLKIARRILKRHKGYAFLNIAGLSAGLTCVLLIMLYVRHEWSYDRYHPDSGRIYRVAGRSRTQGLGDGALSPNALAPALMAEYPDVESAARIYSPRNWFVRPEGEEAAFDEPRLFFADPNIFDVLSIPLTAGNPGRALSEPNTVVISEKAAAKYWGRVDPLNKTIVLVNSHIDGIAELERNGVYTVTGVFRDLPANTHFHADLICSASSIAALHSPAWRAFGAKTYLKMRRGADPREFQAKMQDLYMRNQIQETTREVGAEKARAFNFPILFLQPVVSIHLSSHLVGELEPNGDSATVAVFLAIALLVLIVAGINFVNLATARAGLRAREVGIRKVVGSSRGRLIRQFLTESGLMTSIAFGLALVSAALLLPYFGDLMGRELRLKSAADPLFILTLLAGLVVLSLLAGIYPAIILSSSRPQTVLKGFLGQGRRGRKVRAGLVVFQFAVGLVLASGAFVIAKQIRYIRTADLGFHKDQVLLVDNADLLGPRISAFKETLVKNASVAGATVSSNLPVPSYSFADGIRLEGQPDASPSYVVDVFYVDEDYVPTLGLELLQGRNFSKDLPTDDFSVIINEAMAEKFGWRSPLGTRFRKNIARNPPPLDFRWFTVVGVVKNFNYESVRRDIGPVVFLRPPRTGFVAARLKTRDAGAAVDVVRRTWTSFAPEWPFEYSFMDERFDSMYRSERMTGRILTGFTVLAVLISSLGLFGLAAFLAERRTKEIGIRKVLGASAGECVGLLVKEFAGLVGLANILAAPIAYGIMIGWLRGFAYRTNLGLGVFVAAGLLSLGVAVLTVSHQSLKAALADPVDSLRYE